MKNLMMLLKKELKDRGIDEINKTYDLITSFLENPAKETTEEFNRAVKEIYASVIPQLADTGWSPAVEFSKSNTEDDPFKIVVEFPNADVIVEDLTTAP